MARHIPGPAPPAAATLALLAITFLCAFQDTAMAADSTGWTVQGFPIVSNVTGHLFMSRDACDIAALATAPPPVNFSAIGTIYRNGSNSVRPDGKARRALASWTSGDHATGNPYFTNGSALYNDSNWIGSFMNAALAPTGTLTPMQKAWITIHTTRLQIPLSYMLAELNGLVDEIDPNGTNETIEGAPHALDEGFAVYAGNVSGCAPWAYAQEAAHMFGTLAPDCSTSTVNAAVVAAFKTAQAATFSGNVSQYIAARAVIVRNVQVSLIQNVIMRASWVQKSWRTWSRAEAAAQDAADAFLDRPDQEHRMAAARAAAALANATMQLAADKADAYSVFRALAPFIHAQHPLAAYALNNYLGLDAPVSSVYAAAVRFALQSLYPAMGITPGMVGTYGAATKACHQVHQGHN